jgi:hypothetical protein
VGEINRLKELIQSHNSYRVDYGTEYKVDDLMKELTVSRSRLAALKVAIMEANAKAGLYPKMVARDELKDHIQWLGTINTLHGLRDRGGRISPFSEVETVASKQVEYAATLRQEKVDTLVKEAQADLDKVQSDIDYLNHVTMIELDWV